MLISAGQEISIKEYLLSKVKYNNVWMAAHVVIARLQTEVSKNLDC